MRHLSLGLVLLLAPASQADTGADEGDHDPPFCPLDEPFLAPTEYLRSVSLDLRGVVPTMEEYALVEAEGDVPDELIDAWLDSPEFAERVVRLHRDLLWNNVTTQTLFATNSTLGTFGSPAIYYRRNAAAPYRGAVIDCGTFPAQLDANGKFVTQPHPDQTAFPGARQEGWVEVAPYWAPTTTVRVCGYDAQSRTTSSTGTRCDGPDGTRDAECGCGPGLVWCGTNGRGSVNEAVTTAFGEDVEHRIRAVITEDRPYVDLLTGHDAYVNGPIVNFYRNQAQVPGPVRLAELPVDVSTLPDIPYTDTSWHRVDLPPEHSGVLTSPAFLLRFMTQRARANRFYNAFLCQPFQPPDAGIPLSGTGLPTYDLTNRDGCKYCHALLEPAAAHWGRWTPSGAGHLDPLAFPSYDEECAWCANTGNSCDPSCRRFYLVDPVSTEQDPFVGWLQSYQFLSEAQATGIDAGPAQLVQETVLDGRLPTCVAHTAATKLVGRGLALDDPEYIDALADDLVANGWDYKALVKAIVTSDEYRRIRQ